MGRWEPSRLAELIFGLPAIWLFLWLGLAALTIALLVLMRTSWGQSRPLRKCAVLSLIAHTLFACFATTVKIVSDTAGRPQQETIRVTIADVPAARQEDGRKRDVQRQKPWDSPVREVAEPDMPPPTRLEPEAPAIADRERRTDPQQAPIDAVPRGPARALIEDPDADRVGQMATRPSTPGRSAEPIQIPLPQQREQAKLEVPFDSPARADASAIPAITAARQNSQPDTKRLERPAPAPRMADMEPKQQAESAVAAPEDLLTRASSPVPPTQPASPRPEAKLLPVRPAEGSPTPQGNPAVAASAGPAKEGPAASADPAAADAGRPLAVVSRGSGEGHEMPSTFRQRVAPDRQEWVSKRGGSRETEAAVAAALHWLSASQALDGRWDAVHHGAGREEKVLGHDRQGAGIGADSGISGLALLAFLGAGHTHQSGAYRATVRRGLSYLMSEQAADGNLAGRANLFARMYCHAMATFAMSEAYAMTGDKRLERSVEMAVAYSLACQHPVSGGWRYQPGDEGDTSQLGWQAMALKSAELAGVHVPADVRSRMLRFLASVSGGQHGGLASYRPYRPVSRAMTAEALFCRQLLGDPVTIQASQEASGYLLGELPGQDRANLYYWYYATLSMYQLQGDAWQRWNEALKATLLPSQHKRGDLEGSWDPNTVWGGYGGRVYSTALAALSLEVYYRYLPVYIEAARAHRQPK